MRKKGANRRVYHHMHAGTTSIPDGVSVCVCVCEVPPCLSCLLRPSRRHPRPDWVTWPSPGNEKPLTNHCLLLGAGQERKSWHHHFSLLFVFRCARPRFGPPSWGETHRRCCATAAEMMRSASPSPLRSAARLFIFYLFFLSAQIGLGWGEGLYWQRCEKDMPGCTPVVPVIY